MLYIIFKTNYIYVFVDKFAYAIAYRICDMSFACMKNVFKNMMYNCYIYLFAFIYGKSRVYKIKSSGLKIIRFLWQRIGPVLFYRFPIRPDEEALFQSPVIIPDSLTKA
jgi:hypothetical protein